MRRLAYLPKLFLLKAANIVSNMALRVIRETGKAFQPENEFTVLTSQIILSVEEILKYGLMAMSERVLSDQIYKTITNSSYNYELYKSNIKEAVVCFKNDKDVAWVKIAMALDVINDIYHNYITNTHDLNQATINNKDVENLLIEQKKLTQKIIMYLNVFDGLCHNTGNVFEHICRMETIIKDLPCWDEDMQSINKLFDSKNLKNPYETYEIAKQYVDLPIKVKDIEPLANNSKYKEESFQNRSKNRKEEIESELSETRMEREFNSIFNSDFNNIDLYFRKLPESFIERHKNELNWRLFCMFQNFSFKFVEKYIQYIKNFESQIMQNINLPQEEKIKIQNLLEENSWS